MFKKLISLCLAAILVISMAIPTFADTDTTATVTIEATYCQTEARSMLESINELRTDEEDAWYWDSITKEKVYCTDLEELEYDYDLEKAAMQRAAEIALSYSHTRPNGTSYTTAKSGTFDGETYSVTINGENIVGCTSKYKGSAVEYAFEQWCEESETYRAQGHRENMLSSSYTTIGIACVYFNGYYYWVQEFSKKTSGTDETDAEDGTLDVSIEVLLSDLTSTTTADETYFVGYGETKALLEAETTIQMEEYFADVQQPVTPEYTYEIADESIAEITDDGIYGKAKGSTTLTITANTGSSTEVAITVGCSHEYTSEITTAPGCTTAGIRTYTCSKCGDTYTEEIAATGHSYVSKVTKEATCTEEGEVIYTCEVCGDTYTETIPATGLKTQYITAKNVSKTFKADKKIKKLKKAKTFKLKASTSGNGKITYKKLSGNKKIKVSKTGKVTVKKGLKKGKTYKVKVKVTAAKTSTYNKATKTVTLKIKIK